MLFSTSARNEKIYNALQRIYGSVSIEQTHDTFRVSTGNVHTISAKYARNVFKDLYTDVAPVTIEVIYVKRSHPNFMDPGLFTVRVTYEYPN